MTKLTPQELDRPKVDVSFEAFLSQYGQEGKSESKNRLRHKSTL